MADIVMFFVDCLSVITIVSCLVLKVPQILSIYENKSTNGIDLKALLLELVSYTITTLYNYSNGYSLLTYLEYPIILVQQMVLIYLVLVYSHRLTSAATRYSFLWYWLVVMLFLARALPVGLLGYLLPLCTPISGASKCMYVYAIWRTQSSETTSLLTWLISVVTNVFRIVTIYMDSADTKLLLNFTVSTILSSAVLLTALYYRKCPTRQPHLD